MAVSREEKYPNRDDLAHERGDHSGCGESAACFLEWNRVRTLRMQFQRQQREGLARVTAPLDAVPSEPPTPSGRYRVGNKNARNVYLHVDGYDVHVGCMFDPADGPFVVAALNAYLERGE